MGCVSKSKAITNREIIRLFSVGVIAMFEAFFEINNSLYSAESDVIGEGYVTIEERQWKGGKQRMREWSGMPGRRVEMEQWGTVVFSIHSQAAPSA